MTDKLNPETSKRLLSEEEHRHLIEEKHKREERERLLKQAKDKRHEKLMDFWVYDPPSWVVALYIFVALALIVVIGYFYVTVVPLLSLPVQIILWLAAVFAVLWGIVAAVRNL